MSSRTFRLPLVALLALAAVSVCIVFFVLRRQQPAEEDVEIPVFTAEISTISLPITVDCTAIERMAMEQIGNRPLMEDKLWLKNVRCSLCGGRKYNYVRVFGIRVPVPCPCVLKGLAKSFAVSYTLSMESLNVSAADSVITLVGRIRATARAHAFGATGKSATTIKFTSDRVLAPAEGVIALRGVREPKIEFVKPLELSLSVFKIPVPLSEEIANSIPELLESISGPVDRELTKSVNKLITKGWNALHEPVELASGVWLVFQPEEFQLSPLRSSGSMLGTTVTVRARPEVVLGDEPQVPQVPPMPPVRLGQVEGGLHIVVDAIVPLDEAERLLNKMRGELERELEKATPNEVKVKVHRVRIYSGENWLGLKLEIEKPFEGSVFLEGAPRYDAEKNELYVDDLDFTAETEDLLARSASMLVEIPLLKRHLVDYLQKKARLPVGGPLGEVGRAIRKYEEEVPDYGAVLKGETTSFTMLYVHSTREAIHCVVQADGWAEVTMKSPEPSLSDAVPSPPSAVGVTGTD